MAIQLTITAEAEGAFSQLAQDRPSPFIRVSAGQACGCGRIGYQMAWEDELRPGDTEIETQGLKLVIDPESQPYLDGGIIDYMRRDADEGFVIKNPHIQTGCSCGH
ncbi:MAG: iron-sulfur cluster assembly accessory protein [Firmicutes bacterium]|jgi:iron-sulfur cluster assembly protein|nr:iron-sulfur cluster assembly accessory protein [Bacillota bacterium]